MIELERLFHYNGKLLTMLHKVLKSIQRIFCRGDKMTDVFDVAKYILQTQGQMTTMKLQKLVYYCWAWSMVWDAEAIFSDRVEAWASGPVVPNLYQAHKREYLINNLVFGDTNNLTKPQTATINAVLDAYGDKSAQWLADLTHMEGPWLDARKGIEPGTNSEKEIAQWSTAEYYNSILPDSEPV